MHLNFNVDINYFFQLQLTSIVRTIYFLIFIWLAQINDDDNDNI